MALVPALRASSQREVTEALTDKRNKNIRWAAGLGVRGRALWDLLFLFRLLLVKIVWDVFRFIVSSFLVLASK